MVAFDYTTRVDCRDTGSNWEVIVRRGNEKRVWFSGYGRAAAKQAASVLKRDLARHGDACVTSEQFAVLKLEAGEG